MVFNRTVVVLLLALAVSVAGLVLVPGQGTDTASLPADGKLVSYIAEIDRTWQENSARYFRFDLSRIDFVAPIAVALLGAVIVFGADYAIRRKTKSVIERHFTHTEDKG